MAKITLKGQSIDVFGELPKIGSEAPDFVLVDKDLADKTLADFAGKKKVLNIVVSLDTSICANSAKKFYEELKKRADVVVLVISADLPFAQARICEAENIKNVTTLSMMRSRHFAKDYGVLQEDGPFAGICARAVIVLDQNNKVIYTQLVPEIAQEPDYDKAITALGK